MTSGSIRRRATAMVLAVCAAFAIGALFIFWQGTNPLRAYGVLVAGAFGSVNNIGEGLVKAAPMALCGLSVMIAYKCAVFNIGAQGQLLWGAIAAIWVTLGLENVLPPALVWLLALAAACLAGGLWGLIPGYLKACRGINEIISTILLNYIAAGLLTWLVTGAMRESGGRNPQTDAI
ncbi:MAG: ABC transporter permease, partial [Lachnospiraceae bacterium]|nr:ABC transporter permease [Lachnospiraceae bacterium]